MNSSGKNWEREAVLVRGWSEENASGQPNLGKFPMDIICSNGRSNDSACRLRHIMLYSTHNRSFISCRYGFAGVPSNMYLPYSGCQLAVKPISSE